MGWALLAPLALAACDIDPPARQDPSGEPVAEPPEDSALVASVVAAVIATTAVVTTASDASEALATRLAGLAQAHAAHLDLLVGAVPDAEVPAVESPAVPALPGPALVAVRRSELRLLRTLGESCVDAASGDLARVLASMAASVSQHVATLSPEVAR